MIDIYLCKSVYLHNNFLSGVCAAKTDTSILNVLVPRTASLRGSCCPDKTQSYPQKLRNVWIDPEFRMSQVRVDVDDDQTSEVEAINTTPGGNLH
jgi:hypothetical protein